ncbi:MAG: hypothetical protein ACTJIH_09335 [Brevibacterium aurantiacum]
MIIIQQKGLKCGAALGKGRRNRKVRGAGRRNGFAIEGGTFVSPEYPSLSARDIAEGAEKRRATSKRKFEGSNYAVPKVPDDVARVIGRCGQYEFSSVFEIDRWMRGWKIPAINDKPDVETSHGIYVGFKCSSEMPEISNVNGPPGYVTVTSRFVQICFRLTEIFTAFCTTISSSPTGVQVAEFRKLSFEYLDFDRSVSPEAEELLSVSRDVLFTERVTRAATRWAIAHEMAHGVGGRAARLAAYDRARMISPKLDSLLVSSANSGVKGLSGDKVIEKHRDEVACDTLAADCLAESPFGLDDIFTEACGSLVAIIALIWDGWFQDGSRFSPSHPSPTLRFEMQYEYWLEKLTNASNWEVWQAPGVYAVRDFAYFLAFKNWNVGEYGEHRRGERWEQDIEAVCSVLEASIPNIGIDAIYFGQGSDLHKIVSVYD